jgi:D-sedoheptulose 7-phosphate isomerase
MSVVLPMCHALVARLMLARNEASAPFFARESEPLALVCRQMAERFMRGGRLLAFGTAQCASDAQHIAVEFMHPVLVGKRALPALDLSATYRESLPAIARREDIVVGFGPPDGDAQVDAAVRTAVEQGALSLALPGSVGDYVVAAPSSDPFVHQELIEILYHTLWETVHVFFERGALNQSAGAASFLYPFLADRQDSAGDIVPEVAASIRAKSAAVERLREQVVAEQSGQLADAVSAIGDAIDAGGTVLCFGNGGSATDATDFALDLCNSPKGHTRVPAISLATDPATLTAIANDIGSDALFSRQLIACGRPGDVAVAFSTSGGSANIVAALIEARSRGLLTVALVGYDGGEVLRRRLADHVIVVNSDQIPRVQEAQASIYHVMLDLLEAGCNARD